MPDEPERLASTDTESYGSTSKKGADSDSDRPTNNELMAEISELKDEISDDDNARDIADKRPACVWNKYRDNWIGDDKAPSGLQSRRSAWVQFIRWMTEQEHEYLSDLSSNFVARHHDWVLSNCEKNKLSRYAHLSHIRSIITFAKSRGWIDPEDVPDEDAWAEISPDLSDDDKVRSDPLAVERGKEIMQWVRNERFGSRSHCLWILLFRYGFRVSAVRALDRDDLILSEPDDWPDEHDFKPHLRLRDRPDLGPEDDGGLKLKNKVEELASRRVPLQPEDAAVLHHYVEHGSAHGAKKTRKEHDEPDEYGLYGLLTGEQNPRLSGRTIRERTHWLTCPATYGERCDCDSCREYRREHGRDPYPSKVYKICDETRSPHQIRHGAITRLLDEHDHSTVSRIVGTSPDTLREVYDRADEYRRMGRITDDWLDS